MKHHAILLLETVILEGTYNPTELNYTSPEPNDIPYEDLQFQLTEAGQEYRKLSHHEIKRELIFKKGFIERFPTIEAPDQNGKIVSIPIGQASMIELALAETAIISLWFYDRRGLPVRQMFYDFRVKED